MKKRITALLLAGVLALTLSACGGVTTGRIPQLVTEDTASTVSGGEEKPQAKPDSSKYEDTLIGLLTYMEDGKAIARDTEKVTFEGDNIVIAENTTSFVQMSYKEIGAVNGYRYQFSYNGSTVQAEFYEFDPENLDEKGKACLDSVREKGSFEVLDNEVPAVLHPSEKYLMIYTDTKNDEKNEAQKKLAEELFLSFQK